MIIFLGSYVVQWDAGITLKLLVVLLGSLLVTLGLVELIKRINVLRGLFGMKTRRREMPLTGSGVESDWVEGRGRTCTRADLDKMLEEET